MIANYHTHTQRCMHARGSEEEYVKRAIEAGYKELGFSDHSPYLFPNGFFSDYRMSPEEYDDYADTIERLKYKYADKIKIYLGLEIEYYPKHFSQTLKFILKRDLDYLILGQHFTENEYDGVYTHGYFDITEKTVERYADQVISAVETGLFTYIAHPDIIRFDESSTVYRQQMRKICVAAKKHNIPLEINLGGMGRRTNYPSDGFMAIAGEVGNIMVIGCDSHSVDEVYSQRTAALIDKAYRMAERHGLNVVDTVQLVKPMP